jgi:hypothetical protein
MCSAPERLTAFGARTFLELAQQWGGSQSTVVKSVERT